MSDDELGMSPPASPPAYDQGSFEDESLPKGVKKNVITEGSGWEKPKNLYEVKVNLKAKHGETVFDSNEDEGCPRTYVVGSGLPCKGVDALFKDMKKGEKSTAVVEASLAFGSDGIPEKSVPPDAQVTYEIELVEWLKIEDISKLKDKGIMLKTVVEGPEWDKPKDNDISFLRYRGRVQNEDIYFAVEGMVDGAEPIRIKTSEISPSGLLTTVKELKKGSKAIVTLSPKYAFGDEGLPDKAVPAGATVEYEVELVDVHAVTDVAKDGGILVEVLKKVGSVNVSGLVYSYD